MCRSCIDGRACVGFNPPLQIIYSPDQETEESAAEGLEEQSAATSQAEGELDLKHSHVGPVPGGSNLDSMADVRGEDVTSPTGAPAANVHDVTMGDTEADGENEDPVSMSLYT